MELADGVEHSHSVERRSLRAEALWALERKEGLAQAITSQWERTVVACQTQHSSYSLPARAAQPIAGQVFTARTARLV